MTTASFTAASGRNEFLQLLVTQLQNQDPLEPVGQTEFLQQLAQFSTLEGIEKLNASFAELLRAHELSEGLGLVGRRVRFSTGEGEFVQEGRVEEATVQDGRVLLRIGEQEIAMEHIRSVLADSV